MNDTPTTLVTGLFPDRGSAERAYESAVARGCDRDDIDIVMSGHTHRHGFGDAAEPARAGLHGPLGLAVAALAAASSALGEPGPRLVLAGAGLDGGASGLAGALSGWRIPEARIAEYEMGLDKGAILLGVRARSVDDAQALEAQWRAAGGSGVHA